MCYYVYVRHVSTVNGLFLAQQAASLYHGLDHRIYGAAAGVRRRAYAMASTRDLQEQSNKLGEDGAGEGRVVTPWARLVASGVELLRDPRLNKGLAFSDDERDHHYLRGLLPPAHFSQELQEERVLLDLKAYQDPLRKYVTLMGLQDRNERLFYKILIDNVEELLPIVYDPTVGEACLNYGLIYTRPRGLFISLKDKGRIVDCLRNWPEKNVQAIVVSDGGRILGLGDLGVHGMGIPVGKLALYTALGGVRPSLCLPVIIDVGTDNEDLLKDKFYIGLKRERATGEEYDSLMDEFMHAVKQEYGERVLVQFEDFGNENAFRLLRKYEKTHLTFNDDIQGTATVVLAGLISAARQSGKKLADHKFLFVGAGEAGTGIAEMVAAKIVRESQVSPEDARKNIWLFDLKGLITSARTDSIQPFEKKYAHDHEPCKDVASAVKQLKPTALIGTCMQKGIFSKEVLEMVASHTERPIVMALSNPTPESECTADEAYKHTEGRAFFASGSPFPPVEMSGKTLTPSQANNSYIFPGVALGCIISGAIRVRDDMLQEAAEALAGQVSKEDIDQGLIYPPFHCIRKISAHIAGAVAGEAYDMGLATRIPRPSDLVVYAQSCMYSPTYRRYR